MPPAIAASHLDRENHAVLDQGLEQPFACRAAAAVRRVQRRQPELLALQHPVQHRRVARLQRDLGTAGGADGARSEEHTSELQSLMRLSYAVFCLKKKNKPHKCIK